MFLQPRRLTNKGFRDIVTDADIATQQVITDGIRERFPEHGFLTEEPDSSLPSGGDVTWIIDPIDGTTNYSRQLPTFCVSIAAVFKAGLEAESVLAGVIYDPMRNELFSAATGHGSRLNGESIRVSNVAELGPAIVALDWSRDARLRQDAVEAVARVAHDVHTVRAVGSAALALAWVAAGRIDAYLNFSLCAWDVAAGDLLIREAGGALSDMRTKRWQYGGSQTDCVASNARLHQAFLRLLLGKGVS
jgi:myo-inositol-1(or 4)-monophosphatase